MKILSLFSAQHTGTHFVRFLLELHPNISFFTHQRVKIGDQLLDHYTRQFHNGELTNKQYADIVLSAPEIEAQTAKHTFAELGLELAEKSEIKYKFCLIHAGRWGPSKNTTFKTIVTIRDPLDAIISALKRRSSIEDIVEGLEHCLSLTKCFRVCVDLWQEDKNRWNDLFAYLELPITKSIEKYIEKYPKVGATTLEIAKEYSSDNWIKRVESFKEDLYTKKTIQPLFERYIARLRDSKLEEQLRTIGYENLIWYKNVDLEYSSDY